MFHDRLLTGKSRPSKPRRETAASACSGPPPRCRSALGLLRYIHMNPVKARIVERSQDYRWSSDRLFRGAAASGFHDRDAALALLGPTRKAASRACFELMDGAGAPDHDRLTRIGQVVKGDEEFAIERIAQSQRFDPALRGLSEEHVLAVGERPVPE